MPWRIWTLPVFCSTLDLAGVEKSLMPKCKSATAYTQSRTITSDGWCVFLHWYINYLEWIHGRTLERKANWQRHREGLRRERLRGRDGIGERLWGVMVAWRPLSGRRWVLESFGISNVLYLCWFSETGEIFLCMFAFTFLFLFFFLNKQIDGDKHAHTLDGPSK